MLPNPEVNIHFLWFKVFQQIHLGLVEMQDEQKRVPIGVSFIRLKSLSSEQAFCLWIKKLWPRKRREPVSAPMALAPRRPYPNSDPSFCAL